MRIDSDPHNLYREIDGIRGPERQSRPEAVVRTRKAGLSFGGFGLSYESEEISVDAEYSPQSREARRLERAFETETAVRDLAAEVTSRAVDSRVNWADSLPGTESLPVRQARSAYHRAMQPESPLPGASFSAIA
ncbi:hypothetical protein [Desulfovibrio oxyclinae]|jgi:hypothetical protein|uniref:hypothetical protein n=1 Tax=Desulfovibrio oxyclinae TaxID=63560 RepID=UPI00036E01F3|nr:hypothetical protein [Desulfovibrio oxyclinae]